MSVSATAGEFRSLLDQFADGWNQGEPGRMADAFLPDGVYQPGPFDAPLKGRQAILDYWRDVPLAQSDVSFRYGEIFVAGPWFSTEFRCTYVRRRTGESVDVRGALFCETKDGKIAEMRMLWERRMAPRSGA
ncbi:MAG: nuclear transport factor 2 family protein [Gemmatimonadetes bacterium]|nr:nuclear transport factor 2 family protein [Gemmatimonadota bacterium]MBI2402218.1 nuclear transport factor 2 family protein [Gemmatimonadota bacterium]